MLDRQWMLVKEDTGKFLTARQISKMALVSEAHVCGFTILTKLQWGLQPGAGVGGAEATPAYWFPCHAYSLLRSRHRGLDVDDGADCPLLRQRRVGGYGPEPGVCHGVCSHAQRRPRHAATFCCAGQESPALS